MADLVTVSKVKEFISGKDMRTDGSLPDELDRRVNELLNGAVKRAKDNGRKTVRPEDLAGGSASGAASLTVASRVKNVVSGQDLRSDSGLGEAVNGHVQAMLAEACDRAKSNGRSTVRPYDLPKVS